MIGGLIVFIASVQLIRIAIRTCNHDPNNVRNNFWNNDRNNERDNDRYNDPRQKLLSNARDDGRRFKNVLPRNPNYNFTVSKKDNFNSGKLVTGPI